jgi:hypothetical protein
MSTPQHHKSLLAGLDPAIHAYPQKPDAAIWQGISRVAQAVVVPLDAWCQPGLVDDRVKPGHK